MSVKTSLFFRRLLCRPPHLFRYLPGKLVDIDTSLINVTIPSINIIMSTSAPPSASASTTAQLINADGNFIGNLPVTESEAQTHTYRTVAVVGCQSGGKSTLLNQVFNTNFPVLDAPRLGRRRTTLGIWAAVVPSSESPTSNSRYIVLDVEGTDSRERGEGAKTFENRTTLFTLALSDVVLVNMWAHDLGRYSAANYELFETVFAHALALKKQKLFKNIVKIIIVVRDHDGESAMADIKRILMGDLNNIWDSLKQPDILLTDVFHIDVFTLPHKSYSQGAFQRGVSQLSQWLNVQLFSSSEDDNFVDSPRSLSTPLGGFDALAKQIWNSVSGCTSGVDGIGLDLPKQATLAAHYKCGEIIHQLLNSNDSEVGQVIDALRIDVESQWQNPIDHFSKRVRDISECSLQRFDERTIGYVRRRKQDGEVIDEIGKGVLNAVLERRREFGALVLNRIMEVRERFIGICWEVCMNGFDDDFRPMLGGTRGFERNAKRVARSFIAKYRSLMNEATIPDCLKEFVEIAARLERIEGDGDGDTGVEENEGEENDDGDEEELGDGEEVDVMDLELQVVEMNLDDDDDDSNVNVNREENVDDEDDGGDEWSADRFKKEVLQKIDERKRMGELMLPGAGFGPAVPKREKWWKGILIRGLILLINYVQASQGHRAALKMQREHEKEFPPSPTF